MVNVQKEVKNATSIVGKLFTVAEVIGYAKEFQNQDEFAVESLMNFIENKDSESTMSNAMKSGIEVYTDMLQKDILTYSALQYLMNNYDSLLMDAADLSASLGTEANLILIGWDLVQSANILNIGDKIGAAEQFELATYGTIFESDAFIDYQQIRDNTFSSIDNIAPENLYEVTQACYVYLKFCYITRDAAIASLKAKTEDTQEQIQPLIEYQNGINEEIAEYLVQLKNADTTNKYGCYGFLPEDNVKYLERYNKESLVSIIGSAETVTFERIYENSLEFAVIKGLDNNNNVVWEYETEKYESFMLDTVTGLGIYEDRYYFVENGTIISLKISDGTIIWKNDEFKGAGTDFKFGNDGTLYICGFDTPDFFAVDKNGNSLVRIQSFSENYGCAYKIEYLEDKVSVTLEMGYDDGRPVTFYVNLEDFSYVIAGEVESSNKFTGRWENLQANSSAENYILELNDDMSACFIGTREKYYGKYEIVNDNLIQAYFDKGQIYDNSIAEWSDIVSNIIIEATLNGDNIQCCVIYDSNTERTYTYELTKTE